MKLLPAFLPFVCALMLGAAAHGETAQQLLTSAQLAYGKGDYAAAKRDFEMVLRIDPRNQTAIGFMKMIAARQTKDDGGANAQKELTKLILPKIEFKEATLGSALDFMKKKAGELSNGTQSVNFVVQPGVDAMTTCTLSLSNVPFTEALRYLGEVANISFQYQKYAIVVRPRGAVATSAPAGGEKAAAQ
jgi:hypothetical protein